MSLTVYLDTDYEGGELPLYGADITTDTMLFHGGGLKAVFDSYPEPNRTCPNPSTQYFTVSPSCYSHCVYPLKRGTKSIMRTDFMYDFSKS